MQSSSPGESNWGSSGGGGAGDRLESYFGGTVGKNLQPLDADREGGVEWRPGLGYLGLLRGWHHSP